MGECSNGDVLVSVDDDFIMQVKTKAKTMVMSLYIG